MTDEQERGPWGDARPDAGPTGDVTPSRPQEKVEDRENVSTVTPEDYPLADREDSAVDGRSNRGRQPSQGSGRVRGSGAGAGGGGNPEDYDSDPQGGGGSFVQKPARTAPEKFADAPSGGSR